MSWLLFGGFAICYGLLCWLAWKAGYTYETRRHAKKRKKVE